MVEELKQAPRKPEGDIAMDILISDSSIPMISDKQGIPAAEKLNIEQKRESVRFIIGEIQQIAREAFVGGHRTNKQNIALERFKDIARQLVRDFGKRGRVDDILTIPAQHQTEIAEIVADALHTHFIGFARAYRKGPRGIFDPKPNEDPKVTEARQQYVQEFTALVSEIFSLVDQYVPSSSLSRKRHGIVALAQYRSPTFVKELFDGSLIDQILREDGIDWNTKKRQWFFTSGRIFHVLNNYPKKIEVTIKTMAEAYDRLADRKNGVLSNLLLIVNNRLLPDQYPWSQEEIDNLFTDSAVREAVVRNPYNPEKAIAQIANGYRELSPENFLKLMQERYPAQDWTREQVGRLLIHRVRQSIAVQYSDVEHAAILFLQGKLAVAAHEVTPERTLKWRLKTQ